MTEATKTLARLKKASKLTRLTFHEKGPKSYRRGQGALLKALLENDGATQKDLVAALGCDRKQLKDIVKKAARNGYVKIVDVEQKKTYSVQLTAEGAKVAEKREALNDQVAEDILSCLTEEEADQLNAICEKLIVAAKEAGVSGKKKGRKMHKHHKGEGACGHHHCHGHHGHGHGHGHHHGHHHGHRHGCCCR